MKRKYKAIVKMLEHGKSVSEMAAALDTAERVIYFHLDSLGEKDMTFPAIIVNARGLGSKSLAEYFRGNAEKSFQDMAKDLGVAHSTVEQYYQIFAKMAIGD